MSYITIYLQAADERAMLDALTPLFGTDEDGRLITASASHHAVLLPNLMRPTGVMLEDDIPEMEPVPGYHANLRTKDKGVVGALAHLVVTPNSPSVVFA